MKRTLVRTSSPYEVNESFARAVVVGDWIYVSQCAGINYDTREMPSTAAEQTTLSIDNVERALKAVGSSLNDVVRRQVMIPNVDQAEEIMSIVGERFRDASPSNVVFCSPLGAAKYLVEIEVIAHRGISAAETEVIKY